MLAVGDPDEAGRDEDPSELVPVEEGESAEGGRGAGVERGEAEAEVGQDEEPAPASAVLSRALVHCCFLLLNIRHGPMLSRCRGQVDRWLIR
jgi:hypothetical protein